MYITINEEIIYITKQEINKTAQGEGHDNNVQRHCYTISSKITAAHLFQQFYQYGFQDSDGVMRLKLHCAVTSLAQKAAQRVKFSRHV